eukprot:TRINITY_DN2482_c0_g1_i1.p1 TRINITY_DN2482_c0_g1~~TRINITY_DN2482_c0_g1_i1.p1  ORF type:complete len:136 (-),score=21.73 TRINITY_DN2482_c0_g1_i1:8-415(-)
MSSPMHCTGHVTFTTPQMDFMKQHYKNEAKMIRTFTKALDSSLAQLEPTAAAQNNVDSTERALIYEGISKEGLGRVGYLKAQATKAPQQRFRAPITSSQAIGWDIGTVAYSKSPHARKQIIRDSFERKRGAFQHE